MRTRALVLILGCAVSSGSLYFSHSAFPETKATQPSSIQRLGQVIEQTKRAIVKIRVTGHTPKKKYIEDKGTGFFVFSSPAKSYILTAGHLIGSDERDPTKNEDWQVGIGGEIDRRIDIQIIDEQGGLVERKGKVWVERSENTNNTDLAVLGIDQGVYPTL